jgi:3-keto-disaccharide hydrolase
MRHSVMTVFVAILAAFSYGAAGEMTAPAGGRDFTPIFDGETLSGWDGDPTYWRVEDGKLVGAITPDTLLKKNSWIIWRDGDVEDFELKLEYRISAEGNSGVGYRCEEIAGERFAFRGYQADIYGGDQWTGINYEERGRTFLALRGMKTVIEPGKRPTLDSVFASEEQLQTHVRKGGWNAYHLIVRGGRHQYFLNGVLMNEVTDRDSVNGRRKGLLGVQVHVGPPMKVEFRNILLKRLADSGKRTRRQRSSDEVPVLTFDNPSALRHLREQAEAMR